MRISRVSFPSARRRCLRPRRITLLVSVSMLCVALVPPVHGQRPPFHELKHFKKVRSVHFNKPGTLMIAGVEQIDVDSDGRLLVTDTQGKPVLLYDSTGALLASPDTRMCHPGFDFWPQGAKFAGGESIFVLSSNTGR